MTDRKPTRAEQKAEERRKARLGFVHVAGWVYQEDAPKIRRLIEKAREDVEKGKSDE